MKYSMKLATALAAVTTMAILFQSASQAEGLPSGPSTTAIVHVGYLENDGTYVGAELLYTSPEAARIGADALESGDTSSVAGTDSELIQAIQAGEAHIAVDPGSSGSGCGYGTATPLVCPYVTWTANGRSVPHVSFYDQSSSDWPASAIVANWGSSSVIDTSWSASSCGSYSGAHCVDMYSANYGNTGWVGRTSYGYDSSFHFIDGSVHVYLNDYYVYGTSPHKQAVCHEVGHALGLGHDSAASSCLYFQILTTSTPIAPIAADFSQLALIY